jgi:hypothetical protein
MEGDSWEMSFPAKSQPKISQNMSGFVFQKPLNFHSGLKLRGNEIQEVESLDWIDRRSPGINSCQ